MSTRKFLLEKKYEIAAGLILLVVFAQLLYLIDYQGAVLDEQFYPGVGKYFVTNGDFSPFAFRYHPPLAYYINSLFLYHDSNPVWQNSPFDMGYIIENGYDWNYLLFITRLPIALVSILLGFYIFRWARALYGKKAALLALGLYGFEPTILAHSAIATTDVVAAAFIFIALYYFWRFDKRPAKSTLAIAGITLGLALLSKYTALILVPLMLAFLVYKYRGSLKRLQTWEIIFSYFVIAFFVVWAAYGFQFSTVLNEVHSPEKALDFINQTYTSEFTKNLIFTGLNTPLPATTYVSGLGYNVWHSVVGHDNYFFGDVSNKAQWHYHPVTFLIKTPIPLLILIALFIGGLASRKKAINWKDEKFLLIPAIVYLLFLWFVVSLNLGLRHSIPIYPFLFVIASSMLSFKFKTPKRETAYKALIALLVLWYVAEAAFILPHNMSYFNEFVGGPQNGWLYLADTDVDWGGVEAKELGKYVRARNITDFRFAHGLPDVYAKAYIDPTLLNEGGWSILPPCSPENGIYAVSTSHLTLFVTRECFSWLLNYEPVDKIGYSMFIYNVTDV